MARYQMRDKQSTILGVVSTIENYPTADVVPRAEVDKIFAEIEDVLDNIGYFDELDFKSLKKKYTERSERE
jgi:hypothetical protein